MILHHLSARVVEVIKDGHCLLHLSYLLEFLAAWEKRPVSLTPMAYQWCSAISEAVGGPGSSDIPINQQIQLQSRLRSRRCQALGGDLDSISSIAEESFSRAGHGCDPVRSGATSHRPHGHPARLTPLTYSYLLSITLEIGFHLATPNHHQPATRLDHTLHHEWVFATAFSGDDDGVIADAVSIWIVCGEYKPPGSLARYFTKRVERGTPFSSRLRRLSIYAIEDIWRSELDVSGLETVRLLNCLNVDTDDMKDEYEWVQLLVDVIRSPAGLKNLSSHYWRLLDKLALAKNLGVTFGSLEAAVMRLLKDAEDWDKLELWMVVVWLSLKSPGGLMSEPMRDIEQVTLELLLRQPSALRRFESLCEMGVLWPEEKVELLRICDQARERQLSLSFPSPL